MNYLNLATLSQWRPVTVNRWPRAARWISAVVGALVMLFSASSYQSFFLWKNIISTTFSQTEIQSESIAVVGNVGFDLVSFPTGLLHDYYGSQLTMVIGTISIGGSYILLGIFTRFFITDFTADYWIFDIFYLFVGVGCAAVYMSILMSNAANFSFRRKSIAFGVQQSFFTLGPTISGLVYSAIFSSDSTNDADQSTDTTHTLSSFFFTVATVASIVNILGILFSGRTELEQEKQEVVEAEAPLVNEFDEPLAPPSDWSEYPFQELKISEALKRGNFWILVLAFNLNVAAQFIWQNNLSTFLASFSHSDYLMPLVVLYTLASIGTKIGVGFACSKLVEKKLAPRSVVFVPFYAFQTVMLFVSFFCGDQIVVIILDNFAIGACNGLVYSLVPTILGELFGDRWLGSNWGFALLFNCVISIPMMVGYSLIYQNAIFQPGQKYCYGLDCFRWSYLMMAGTSLAGTILIVCIYQNMTSNAELRQSIKEQKAKDASNSALQQQQDVELTGFEDKA